MSACRPGVHVQNSALNLVEPVLPQSTPSLDELGELHGRRIEDEGWRGLKATYTQSPPRPEFPGQGDDLSDRAERRCRAVHPDASMAACAYPPRRLAAADGQRRYVVDDHRTCCHDRARADYASGQERRAEPDSGAVLDLGRAALGPRCRRSLDPRRRHTPH